MGFMATELGNVSLQNGNQNLACLEGVRNWVHGHPTTAKILKIAGLILGIGLLASIPFAIPLGIGIVAGLAVAGIIAIVASLILFACRPPAVPKANVSHVDHAVKPDILPITDLWGHLSQKTQAQLQGLEFLSAKDLNHRFLNIRCPKKTAVAIAGQYLHANTVGEGIAQRSFVASQAPLAQDYEIFWKAIFEGNPTIFDLTTIEDQTDGGVTKYYPDKLNEAMKYGSMSVKLIEVSGRTYTYQIENTETEVVKNIKRCHYADWKDLSAVSLPKLHALVQEVETLSPNPKDLLWIHCRAGVGRTGSLITALVLKEKIKLGEINKENLDGSLMDIIVELRKQRGPAFVQQKEQLDLLRQYANSLLVL
jgi:protein tyrosine phosphatase